MPSISSASRPPVGTGTLSMWCGSPCSSSSTCCNASAAADQGAVAGCLPGRVGHQLTAIEAPDQQGHGQSGEGHAQGQCIDQAGALAFVLDQKEQTAEQTGHGGQQQDDDRRFEHGVTPGEG